MDRRKEERRLRSVARPRSRHRGAYELIRGGHCTCHRPHGCGAGVDSHSDGSISTTPPGDLTIGGLDAVRQGIDAEHPHVLQRGMDGSVLRLPICSSCGYIHWFVPQSEPRQRLGRRGSGCRRAACGLIHIASSGMWAFLFPGSRMCLRCRATQLSVCPMRLPNTASGLAGRCSRTRAMSSCARASLR